MDEEGVAWGPTQRVLEPDSQDHVLKSKMDIFLSYVIV